MKKMMAGLLAVMLMVCCVSAFAEGKALTKEEAMKTAAEYAGLRQDQVQFTKVRQDWDDGRQVYEIEFICDGVEYEMDVDVMTGRVTDFKRERCDRYDDHDWDDDWDNDWDDWFDFD